MQEMLEGGDLDVLTGDYLAELTMLLLWRTQAKDPSRGYAATFVRQLEECLGIAWERGVKIVTNAGGLNPAGCAAAVREIAGRLGLRVNVAHVEGDDLLPRRDELSRAGIELPDNAITANAYLGGWGIAAALDSGAQVVVTGRVTDAALVIGPAAWWHGWGREDYDQLAGALVTGHILECGAQATGGNYSFFTEVPGMEHIGFPLAEIEDDGSAVITKHDDGLGGLVDVGTVTAQLLYEIQGPLYLNPDVSADFSSIQLEPVGINRVQVSGVRGTPPPPTTKICLNTLGGFRNSMTFLLTGLDIDAKADLIRRQLEPALTDVEQVEWTLSHTERDDAATNEQAVARFTISVKDDDAKKIGRPFSGAAVEIALASYPGATMTSPPGEASPFGVYQAAYLPNHLVEHRVVAADGSVGQIQSAAGVAPVEPAVRVDPTPLTGGATWRVPLGTVAGARSGDKGGNGNVGVWVGEPQMYRWLENELTVERLKQLLPEAADLVVRRYPLPNLSAINFVIERLLGDGVASSTRQDPQAKGLGEWLRSRYVDIPVALLEH
jgi:hypothetical protein